MWNIRKINRIILNAFNDKRAVQIISKIERLHIQANTSSTHTHIHIRLRIKRQCQKTCNTSTTAISTFLEQFRNIQTVFLFQRKVNITNIFDYSIKKCWRPQHRSVVPLVTMSSQD